MVMKRTAGRRTPGTKVVFGSIGRRFPAGTVLTGIPLTKKNAGKLSAPSKAAIDAFVAKKLSEKKR